MSGRTDLLSKYEIKIREKLVHTMLAQNPAAPYNADVLIKEARILTDFILGREPQPGIQVYDPRGEKEISERAKPSSSHTGIVSS